MSMKPDTNFGALTSGDSQKPESTFTISCMSSVFVCWKVITLLNNHVYIARDLVIKQDIRVIYSAGAVNESVQKLNTSVYKSRQR